MTEDLELRKEFYQFCLQYEKRHGGLTERVVRMEATLANLVTSKDLFELKADILAFREAVKNMQTLSNAMASQQDLDWMKRSFWWGMAILSGIILTIAGFILTHVFPRVP